MTLSHELEMLLTPRPDHFTQLANPESSDQ